MRPQAGRSLGALLLFVRFRRGESGPSFGPPRAAVTSFVRFPARARRIRDDFLFAKLAAAAEHGGRLRQQADRNITGMGLRRAFSPAFPAGGTVLFIPWRVVAEESGAANYGFGPFATRTCS